MAANWTAFVSGEILTAEQLNGVVDNFADIAIFNETQTSSTAGGTFTSGSYVKRTLNTTVVNNIAGCSIASSVITLPAGTFVISASAPAYNVARHQTRIANTTASTYSYGENQYMLTYSSSAPVLTTIVLTVSSTIELQHRCSTTVASFGLGIENAFGTSSVYGSIKIERVA